MNKEKVKTKLKLSDKTIVIEQKPEPECLNCKAGMAYVGDDPNMDHDWYCPKCHSMYHSNELVERIDKPEPKLKHSESAIYSVKYIDAYAMGYALVNHMDIKNVEIALSNPVKEEYVLRFTYERYAMNGGGYHVGYETVVFEMPCIRKKDLGIHGIPYIFSSLVVRPDDFAIKDKSLPETEIPSIDSHDSDCAVHSEEYEDWDWDEDPWPDHCDCGLNDMWDGYDWPEDDFFESQLQNIIEWTIENNDIPEIEYESIDDEDGKYGIWRIEDREWVAGDMDNKPDIEWQF